MWTAEQRARHKVAECKERRGYPTDISDQDWVIIEPLLPCKARTGRPQGRTSPGHQCAAISSPFRLRMAHAAQRFLISR